MHQFVLLSEFIHAQYFALINFRLDKQYTISVKHQQKDDALVPVVHSILSSYSSSAIHSHLRFLTVLHSPTSSSGTV